MARLAVIGQSGTGKSYAAGALLERVLDTDHPDNGGETFDIAVHFDPENEEIGLSAAEHNPLYKRFEVDAQTAKQVDWVRLIYNHRRIRVVPDMTEEQMAKCYGDICGAVFGIVKDGAPQLTALVSADEAGQYVKQGSADDRVLTLQSRGRKYGAETSHSMQRPQQVHTEIISQADIRFYFRVTDDNDIGKLDRQTSFPASRLKSLEDREVIIENSKTGEMVRESTNSWNRIRPHYAGDDGITDNVLPV